VKKRVLILGSTGMLGHQVYKRFNELAEYEVFDISFRNKLQENTIILDIKDKNEVDKTIEKIQPHFIINCIGILISGSNNDYENAIYINAYLPHYLKQIANKIDAKLIHISTDCVFSGEKGKYTETDEKDGKDIYSKTKAMGEIIDEKHLTLRTSIIGPELKENGEGLFHWFMNQSGTINGFTKAIWSGVTTLELSRAIQWAIENDINGLYHVTNNDSINKYDLLNLFKKYTKKKIEILAVDGKSVDKSFIDTQKKINYILPSYETMISEMISNINRDENSYTYLKNKDG